MAEAEKGQDDNGNNERHLWFWAHLPHRPINRFHPFHPQPRISLDPQFHKFKKFLVSQSKSLKSNISNAHTFSPTQSPISKPFQPRNYGTIPPTIEPNLKTKSIRDALLELELERDAAKNRKSIKNWLKRYLLTTWFIARNRKVASNCRNAFKKLEWQFKTNCSLILRRRTAPASKLLIETNWTRGVRKVFPRVGHDLNPLLRWVISGRGAWWPETEGWKEEY